jgi:tyrosine-protein phosphatase YwqE
MERHRDRRHAPFAIHLGAGHFITINDTALVQFDYTQWATYPDEASVERIAPIQDHPARVIQYVEHGYLSQITAMSLTGELDPEPKKTAEYLLRKDATQVMASDTDASGGLRQPWPTDMVPRLEKLVGEDAAHQLV